MMNARNQWKMFAMLLDQAASKYENGSDIWAALKSVSITAQAIAEMENIDPAETGAIIKQLVSK